jgi:aryl-alcohol dehydrogenase-like predicted oxidoreductase
MRLGRTGLQVSRLCLGTMTFGLQCDEPTSRAILDRAAEGGVDFIDSSDSYPLGGELSTRGQTEEILGRWLQGKRDRFIVATKCFLPTGLAPFDRGNSRKHIMSAVEASLRRLQTDYIDLYQLHGYDPATPIDETLGALDDLVHHGKVRYIGCSNFLTYQLVRAVGRTETLRLVRMDCVQPRYNLLFRQIEREMLPFCGEEGVGVIPYNPIAGGLLSGKYSGAAAPPAGRFTLGNAGGMYQDRYWHDREFGTVEELRKLADEAGEPGHARGRVGGREPRGHRADHRGKQPGAARPEPGRRRVPDQPRPQEPARRANGGVPPGGRAAVTVTAGRRGPVAVSPGEAPR